MPTTANAWRWAPACVLAWFLEPLGIADHRAFMTCGDAAFPQEGTAPAAQRRTRPQAGAGGGPAPADEAPGRTTAPGRSEGRASRRAARPAQGTPEEGPPAQRSEAGGPGRSQRRTQQNDLVLLGWCPFQPNKNFRFVGYRAAALQGPLFHLIQSERISREMG